MSEKRKAKQPPATISITGGVKGVGNVIGNDSQSNVSLSTSQDGSSSTRKSSSQLLLWSRLFASILALAGILALIGIFVRLLEGFDAVLVAEFVLAGLISALGISGVLKPKMLGDLLGKILEKK